MYLFPYAGYEPTGRKKKARPPKKRKAQPSRARIDVVLTYMPTYFTVDQCDQVPGMPNSLKALMFEVCKFHKITPNDLVGLGRVKALITARKDFTRRARDELGVSFPRIGHVLKRDHTTAVYNYYGRRRIRESLMNHPIDGRQEVGSEPTNSLHH